MKVFFGLDIATEGARLVIIDEMANVRHRFKVKLTKVELGQNGSRRQDSNSWFKASIELINLALHKCDENNWQPISLSITATSGTFVITDENAEAITDGIMYNDGTADNPYSRAEKLDKSGFFKHVPEFVISKLSNTNFIVSDSSHCLKTGFNLAEKKWNVSSSNLNLPDVVAPGSELIELNLFGHKLKVIAGMTDGCTSQISGGGVMPNAAVTTLGTTMVLKQTASKNISGPGFYSHYLADGYWLLGGASNLGGISYRDFNQLNKLGMQINLEDKNEIVCYPLAQIGERFPIKNGQMKAIWSENPKNKLTRFRSILEGIGYAEKLGYELLARAGADTYLKLSTVGGGSSSNIWNQIRATILQTEIEVRKEAGSDLGAAMIALAANQTGPFAKNLSGIPLPAKLSFQPNSKMIPHYQSNYEKFLELISVKDR